MITICPHFEGSYFCNKKASPCNSLVKLARKKSGRQDSNLRSSTPEALNSRSEALGFQAMNIFLLSNM